MTKKLLDEHLVTYYNAKKLTPERKKEMLALINNGNRKQIDSQKKESKLLHFLHLLFRPGNLAYAAVVLVFSYAAYHLAGVSYQSDFQTELSAAVSQEIAMNHTSRFKVDFREQTVAKLAKQMDKLDFTLLLPARLPSSLKITGARYCSIRGKIAAQIQMTDGEGNFYTLYQTKLVEPLTTIADTQLNLAGNSYKLWHENGVFFGFAGPAEVVGGSAQ